MNNIKIIGSLTVGSYSTWAMWTAASMYNICDHIICINGGLNLDDENNLEKIVPLERERQQLKQIDIENKITQILPTKEILKKVIDNKTELLRGGNMTLSYKLAYQYAQNQGWNINNTYILKLDSDEILHHEVTRDRLINLTNKYNYKGFRISMFSEFYREWDKCTGLPDDQTNDAPLFFCNPNASTTGQGSPLVGDQHPIYDLWSYHMRSICPDDVDEYDYFYKRFFYHCWGPNSIMELQENKELNRKLTIEEIKKIAHEKATPTINSEGKTREHFLDKDENVDKRFPPHKPKVVTIGAKKYIEEGWPK